MRDRIKAIPTWAKVGAACIIVMVPLGLINSIFGGGGDPYSSTTATTTTKSSIEPAPRKPAALHESETIPADGYFNMGGIDGKSWGVWTSDGPIEGMCSWSIRSVSRYAAADVLDSGQSPTGQPVRVDVEPDGNPSSLTGEIGGHRIVFQTQNCGTWKLAR